MYSHNQRLKWAVGILFVAICTCAIVAQTTIPWVEPAVRRAVNRVLDQFPGTPTSDQPYVLDSHGRVVAALGQMEAACPMQSHKTAVILTIGQSNAANSGERSFSTAPDGRVLNYWKGKCFVATSPLLGATGTGGEPWTLLAKRLIASGQYQHVVLVASAINGSPLKRWKHDADLGQMLATVLTSVKPVFEVTHVLWHQGEADAVLKTSTADYVRMFREMVRDMRRQGINAPVYISVASLCNAALGFPSDNPIVLAQRTLPDPKDLIFQGPDTDRLIALTMRRDGCHLNELGLQMFAHAWAQILIKN